MFFPPTLLQNQKEIFYLLGAETWHNLFVDTVLTNCRKADLGGVHRYWEIYTGLPLQILAWGDPRGGQGSDGGK